MAFGDKAIDYVERKLAGMVALMQNLAGHAESEMKMNAPWRDRTGHARAGLHAGVEVKKNEFVLFLAHSMDYGAALEKGTPPHMIRPRNKKALYWPGANHPVKRVRHPGTKAYSIVRPTAEEYKVRLRKTVADWWSDK